MITYFLAKPNLDDSIIVYLNQIKNLIEFKTILNCSDYSYFKNEMIEKTGIDFVKFKNAYNTKKIQIARDFSHENVNFGQKWSWKKLVNCENNRQKLIFNEEIKNTIKKFNLY